MPGHLLGQKMPRGEYRTKKLFTKVKTFSAGGNFPKQISGYAPVN